MSNIRFGGAAYDPDETLKMSKAYDVAAAQLLAAGTDFDREALATVILALGKTFERDVVYLASKALARMNESSKRTTDSLRPTERAISDRLFLRINLATGATFF